MKNKRRILISFFTSMYFLLSGFFTFKFIKKQNNKNTKINSIEKLEIPLVHHCNLNCASCMYFAPIAQSYHLPPEILKKDLIQMSYLTNGNIEEIAFIGGEPFLHDNLCGIFRIAREIFPKSKIEIYTNGTLFEKQSSEVWESCNKNDIGINIIFYRFKNLFNFEYIANLIDKYKVKIRTGYPKYQTPNSMFKANKNENYVRVFEKCKSKSMAVLENGKLYSCHSARSVNEIFNKKFPEKNIPYSNSNFLDIHKVKSFKEIEEFLEKPKEICAYCTNKINLETTWKKSNYKIEEWVKG